MLTKLPGVGPKTEQLLNKLNIYKEDDLINYYPYRYEIIKRSNISEIKDGDKIIIDGIVESKPTIYFLSKKLKKISFRINTGNNIFNINAYNQVYLLNQINVGMDITVIGKYSRVKNAIIATSIRYELLPLLPKIEPIYHTTNGMSIKVLSKIIDNAINSDIIVKDYIPQYLVNEYGFINKDMAVKEIHNPTNINLLKKARLRLKYEELFMYMLKISYLKNKIQNDEKSIERKITKKDINDFIKTIPFELTNDQKNACNEIIEDMKSKKRMNRLLQGDVGSGKTIVAFISAYANYLSKYQTAIMVPTEILANQHYDNAINLFKNTDMKIDILTSSTKAKEKKEIYERLEKGVTDLIIGTQSLIQETIKFKNLGLVITDEQHRFGVNQRNNFKNKGITPDILSMSATPIPRTYALTIYGDLDLSNIKTKPIGRKDVITKIFKEDEITDVLNKMNEELINNHQIYVIAPMIEDMDEETESVHSLEEKMNKAFGKKYKISCVHGKLDTKEKNKTMDNFANNKIDILISTTVIEVGLDVKNASMIVIFNANNFGLSQLHQLRGRVGRSDIQSYCLLITKHYDQRLNILQHTNDGFEISEFDFKNRGEGELFGVRQSGENSFNLANIRKDYKILLKAKEDANKFIENKLIMNYDSIYNELLTINELE